MAMAKKGSRNITVDEVPYRWRIRDRPTYSQQLGDTNLLVAVETITDGDLCTLLVDTSAFRPGNDNYPRVSVTPAVVEAYIRLALSQGWKPGEKGKSFILVADESMVAGKT